MVKRDSPPTLGTDVFLPSVEIVPDTLRQTHVHAVGALVKHGVDQNRGPEHDGVFPGPHRRIVGEFIPLKTKHDVSIIAHTMIKSKLTSGRSTGDPSRLAASKRV